MYNWVAKIIDPYLLDAAFQWRVGVGRWDNLQHVYDTLQCC